MSAAFIGTYIIHFAKYPWKLVGIVIGNYLFLPTKIFFFHTIILFFIYICNPQKEVIISWICCCDDLVISREKVHMMNSHFFIYVGIWLARFPWFFFIKIKPSYNQSFTKVYAITTTRPHPFNLVQNFAADFELVSN